MGLYGPGSLRQQWITYRDMVTYQCVVRRAPLYPISSLMTQGICRAPLSMPGTFTPDLKDLQDDIRMFFASGTQLQELYIRPQMLSPAEWDALAEGAAWSQRQGEVLADAHWIGGDPGHGEVYGYAAWSPRRGTLALRNPSASPASLEIDIQKAFELPPGAAQEYELRSPWKAPPDAKPLSLRVGQSRRFILAPFEVLVFDAVPR
jgi:hypothetical protein